MYRIQHITNLISTENSNYCNTFCNSTKLFELTILFHDFSSRKYYYRKSGSVAIRCLILLREKFYKKF